MHDWLNRLLPALAQQIAAAQGIAVNNGELLGLAAACHQRLHRRLARQLLRAEQAACPV
ncbi:hypothetical protein [Aquitalea magnusonii]|uniref:hypothetical protein n=1 Tax=Aquitalea magnusonii TaxID=332411 RepID=UPI0013144ED3|nr:hypothetical protein [Aquitalea magnusonii]